MSAADLPIGRAPRDRGRGARSSPFLPAGTLAGFIIAILAVTFIALFTYRSLLTRSVTARRITQTLDTIQQLEELHSSLKDAETGQRGFLLTGDESFLEPYTLGRTSLVGAVDALRRQLDGNPAQLRRADALQQLVDERMAVIDRTIAEQRSGDPAAALAIVRSDRGRAAMVRIRTVVDEMENAERVLLAARQDEWQQAVDFSSRVTWGGSVLLLFLIAAAAMMTSSQFRTRETEMWIRAGHSDLS
jgi:CHASE3 domain sensor protein